MMAREDVALRILEGSRKRERWQTLFYRRLAAEAESRGDVSMTERLNELHADEQHHLSRLTARVLELGGTPRDLRADEVPPIPSLEDWEAEARVREGEEVSWYREALEGGLDSETEALLREILESEEHHARDLGGKWMSA